MTKNEFELLTNIEKHGGVSKEFEVRGWVSQGRITDLGYEALEPYKVKRAIFIAAGFGSRMVPITINTPKPLVRVNGTRIIDTLLDAVVEAEIEEIIIVRGYLGEQFDQLLYKYPNIKFIDNIKYNEMNNISSALLIKEKLSNSYVLEGDLVLSNKNLIQKYQYSSNYLGYKVEKTKDWCFKVEDNVIKETNIGGENCYLMVGLSYWDKEDGKKLSKYIKKVFDSESGKSKYWDEVSLIDYKDEFCVKIRECSSEDIIEIDTYEELKAVDKIYR